MDLILADLKDTFPAIMFVVCPSFKLLWWTELSLGEIWNPRITPYWAPIVLVITSGNYFLILPISLLLPLGCDDFCSFPAKTIFYYRCLKKQIDFSFYFYFENGSGMSLHFYYVSFPKIIQEIDSLNLELFFGC